jgi:hypothetical protein
MLGAVRVKAEQDQFGAGGEHEDDAMIASCSAGKRRSLHNRKAALSRTVETALICTGQPRGFHPIASAATTPNPATCASPSR